MTAVPDLAYEERLLAFVGRVLQPLTPGQDPVNVPMIRHWVEAMELSSPVHLDPAAAKATGRHDVVAPAAMMQAWTMRGYAATVRGPVGPAAAAGFQELVDALADGGYTSVVATDSDFELVREVSPGDHVSVEEVVEAISPEKRTGLGVGRFVTTVKTYRDAAGDVVATQRWRTLRFTPSAPPESAPPEPAPPEPGPSGAAPALEPRPRPALNRDNRFWFEAAREHRLLVQRCVTCGRLRHPPGPCCPHCRSFEWDTIEASGKASLYSWVVVHHPRHPAFDYPLLIALVELAEGTRLTTNLVGVDAADLRVGMPLELSWVDADPELSLPVFRPAARPDPTTESEEH